MCVCVCVCVCVCLKCGDLQFILISLQNANVYAHEKALSPDEIQALGEEILASDDVSSCGNEFVKELRFVAMFFVYLHDLRSFGSNVIGLE